MQIQLYGPREQGAFEMIQSNLPILQMWELRPKWGSNNLLLVTLPGAESQLGFRPCDAFFQGSFFSLLHAYLSLTEVETLTSYPIFLSICQTLLLFKNAVLQLLLLAKFPLLLLLVLCTHGSKVNHTCKKKLKLKKHHFPWSLTRGDFYSLVLFLFFSGSDCQTLISMFLSLSYFYSIYCLRMGIELCCPASSLSHFLSVFRDDCYSFWSAVLLNCNLHLHFALSNFNQFS